MTEILNSLNFKNLSFFGYLCSFKFEEFKYFLGLRIAKDDVERSIIAKTSKTKLFQL